MKNRWILFTGIAILAAAQFATGSEPGTTDESVVPEGKRTKAGLYVTPRQAYEMWRAAPDDVKIIDVRTPEEYIYVGHAEMAWNVPLLFVTHQWDADKKKPKMRPNPDFVEQVKRIVKPTDRIVVTCRSGQRGAPASDALTEAGLEHVYHLYEGIEGDKVRDPRSAFDGQRMKNGWKNRGLPWTYALDPERMFLAPSP